MEASGLQEAGQTLGEARRSAAEKQEAGRQKQADKFWGQKLEKLRVDLLSKDADKRGPAEQASQRGDRPAGRAYDLGAFRARERAAADGRGADARARSRARRRRTGWRHWRSSVRGRTCASKAIATLRLRDPRDVIGRLIAMLHKPFKYQVSSGERPRVARRAIRRRRTFQHPAILSEPDGRSDFQLEPLLRAIDAL